MSPRELHSWLVRLAVEAGADVERAHERMAQAATALAIEAALRAESEADAGGPPACCITHGVYRACAQHAEEIAREEREERFDHGAEANACCRGVPW